MATHPFMPDPPKRPNAPRTRLTSQGQTSIPAEVRKALHIEPGTELVWTVVAGHLVVEPVRETTLRDLQDALKPSGARLSVEDMDEALRARFRGRK
ncbi:AbrB/MazE/SpoVT family DNA-binding domain-containing protein [Holophaga foetida]|uniref:AbrB/MazE/SpoVT family DNA-binding domain-containing protein n=1 Tax=Holophaga foetida TaxID=35839 RepID=UPI00024742C4|nr:AbrB/MazE/SpoVT family DNA-binding domain-containing protein [Holophaga foetida]